MFRQRRRLGGRSGPKRRKTIRKTAVKRARKSIGKIKGNGWYGTDIGNLLGGIGGGIAGAYFGKSPTAALGGSAGGSLLGSAAGGLIDRLAGHGSYGVQANSIVAQVQEGVQIPAFGNMAQATVIRHREFIQDITANGGTTFTLQSFPLNPGLATSFPWLAGVASNYDAYQILGMVFEFKTTSSDTVSSAGGPLGSVVMATDYDTVDANYISKLQMENSQFCVSSKPSMDMLHCIECAPASSFSPVKFIRSTVVPSGKDVRLYDHGNFQLATVGLAASSGNIGELWCTYEVALFKPSLNNSLDYSNQLDHFVLSTSISTSHYLSADTTTVHNAASGSTLGGTTKNSTYYFPLNVAAGDYMIIYFVSGASTTLTTSIGALTLSNCSTLNYFAGDTTYLSQESSGATSQTQWFSECVTVTATPASVAFSTGTLPGTITSGDFYVIGISSVLT